jgi:hypothetical protein
VCKTSDTNVFKRVRRLRCDTFESLITLIWMLCGALALYFFYRCSYIEIDIFVNKHSPRMIMIELCVGNLAKTNKVRFANSIFDILKFAKATFEIFEILGIDYRGLKFAEQTSCRTSQLTRFSK